MSDHPASREKVSAIGLVAEAAGVVRSPLVKYLLTAVLVAAATALQWLLWPIIEPAPFIIYYPTIILASLYGDGLSAILLSSILAQYFFVPPTQSLSMSWPTDYVRQAIFLFAAFLIRMITYSLAQAVARARDEARKHEASKARLATTLGSIGDAVIATDREGRVEYMNEVAEALTETALADVRGRPLAEIFRIVHRISREPVVSPVDEVIETGEIATLARPTVLIGMRGRETAIEDSAAPIRSARGEPVEGVVLVFRDVNLSNVQADRLSQAFEELQISEARMRSILENALDGVVGMDAGGRITHWNPQAERIFGFAREEAVGRRMSETIIPPQYREAHEHGMKHYLATGVGTVLDRRIEITALRRSGEEFPIELSITPIRSASMTFFAAFIRDISDAKRLERDLVMKGEALENSLNAFDIVDEGGRFVYANRAYLKMWGYDSLEELLRTSPADHCADPEVPGRIIGALKEGGECEIEFEALRKDGSTFEVLMWARLAHDSEGHEIYPTTAIDVTERKRSERALEQAVRARDEFISIASHELKTPLTSMKLQFQIADRQLKAGDPKVFEPAALERRIATVNRQLDRMATLIEQMLDVSQTGQGRLKVELAPVDLAELAREVLDRFQEQFDTAGIRLASRIPNGPVIVQADRFRLEQVIANLLTNAIKYGNGTPVDVSLEVRGDFARLSVSDLGPGVAEHQLERIFERFERAVSASNISGLGLGLYISRQIVEAHLGRIWAESESGRGTAFHAELPLSSAASRTSP